jgi:hypothetical protein
MTFDVKSFANGNERKMKEILGKLPVWKSIRMVALLEKKVQLKCWWKWCFGGTEISRREYPR